MNQSHDLFDQGDIAWVLMCSALVLLLIPGVAFFYGGLTRLGVRTSLGKKTLSAAGLVGVLWMLFGYPETFGTDLGSGVLGNPFSLAGMRAGLGVYGSVPVVAFAAFQGMVAMFAVALVSVTVVHRTRFLPWLVFAGLWAALVYFPVAHWVFAFDLTDAAGQIVNHGGWLANRVLLFDLAGGTAVHLSAGATVLSLAAVLRRRAPVADPDAGARSAGRANLPFVFLGAGLLWFGWFGYTTGFELNAGPGTSLVFVNTLAAGCASMFGWLLVDQIRGLRTTASGGAQGIVAGVVTISAGGASVSPLGALAVGALGGVLCALVAGSRRTDPMRTFTAVHLGGGLLGTLLVAVLASDDAPSGAKGLLSGGGWNPLWHQALGAGVVLVYAVAVSTVLAWAVQLTLRLRTDAVPPVAADSAPVAEPVADRSSTDTPIRVDDEEPVQQPSGV